MNPKTIRKAIFKAIATLFLLINVTASAQPLPRQYLVSRIDGENFTIKYQYNAENKLVTLTLFNKKNLGDVKTYNFVYTAGKITVTTHGTGWGLDPQTFITDIYGHITEGFYEIHSPKDYTFYHNYKFVYSQAGYLQRLNLYSRENKKLEYVYQVIYDAANVSELKTIFNPATNNNAFKDSPRNGSTDQSFMAGIDYEMSYYDSESTLNFNLLLQIFSLSQYADGGLFLGIPGNVLGEQANKLLASVTIKRKGYGNYGTQEQSISQFKFNYEKDSNGLIKSIKINDNVFIVTYKSTK